MCDKCFKREEPLKIKERRHQCEYGDKCFYNPNFAYFLIDLLSQDSLKLSPMDLGYFLCKPFKMPECPICYEEYSITLEEKSSFLLLCNHMICTECHLKIRTLKEGWNKDTHKYNVKCPICKVVTGIRDGKWKDRLQDFWAELPEMTRQLEEIGTTDCRFCKKCNRQQTIDDLLHYEECQKNACGTCGFKKHRFHSTHTLLEIEPRNISELRQKPLMKGINIYKTLLPELHTELMDDFGIFEKRLLSKQKNIQQASNYEDLEQKHDKCMKLKADFEAIFKEYMLQSRKCGTKVKDLIKSLDDDDDQFVCCELKFNYFVLIYFAIGLLILFMLFYLRL